MVGFVLVFVVIVYDVFDENLRNDDGIVADKVFFVFVFLACLVLCLRSSEVLKMLCYDLSCFLFYDAFDYFETFSIPFLSFCVTRLCLSSDHIPRQTIHGSCRRTCISTDRPYVLP